MDELTPRESAVTWILMLPAQAATGVMAWQILDPSDLKRPWFWVCIGLWLTLAYRTRRGLRDQPPA